MPCSSTVHLPASSDEAFTLPRERSIPLPSCARSLSLAVMDTTVAPCRENSAITVRCPEQLGPGHHHGLARVAVEVEVAGDAVHGLRHAGGDGHVVGAGEARHAPLGHRAEARS